MMTTKETFSVVIDLPDFNAEEICVKILGNQVLVVEAKHSERIIPGHGPMSRHFLHRYRLPAGINADSINCHLSLDQKLTVVAEALSQESLSDDYRELYPKYSSIDEAI